MDPINFGLWRFQQNTTSIPSNISVNKSATVLYNYDADTTILYFISYIQNTDTWEQSTEFAIQRTEDLSTLENVTSLSEPAPLPNVYRNVSVRSMKINENAVYYNSNIYDFAWPADAQLVDESTIGSSLPLTSSIISHDGSNGTWVSNNINVTLDNYYAAMNRQMIEGSPHLTDLHFYFNNNEYIIGGNKIIGAPFSTNNTGGSMQPGGLLSSADGVNFAPVDIKPIDYSRYSQFRAFLTCSDLIDETVYTSIGVPPNNIVIEDADNAKWTLGPAKTNYNNTGYVISEINTITNHGNNPRVAEGSQNSFNFKYHPVHYFNNGTNQFLLCEDGYLLKSSDMWVTFTGGYFYDLDHSNYNYCNAVWAVGNDVVIIMRNGHVYRSSDGGVSFTLSTALVDKIVANATSLGYSSTTLWSQRFIMTQFGNSFMLDGVTYVVIGDLLLISQDLGASWNISRLSGGHFSDWVFKGPAGDVYINGNNTSPFRIYNSSTGSWPPDVSTLGPVSGDNTLRNVNTIFWSADESKYLAFGVIGTTIYEVPSVGGIITGATPTITTAYNTQLDTANAYSDPESHGMGNSSRLQAYSQLQPGVYSRHNPQGMGATFTLDTINSNRKFYYMLDYASSNVADEVGGTLALGPIGGELNNPIFFGQWLYAFESADGGLTATHTTRFSPITTLPTATPRYFLEGALEFRVNLSYSGSGYTDPTVTISAPDQPGGRQAVGFVTLVGDVLSQLFLTDVGSGYTSPATFTITDPTGSGGNESGTLKNVSYLDYIEISDPDKLLLYPYENTKVHIASIYLDTGLTNSTSLRLPIQFDTSAGITGAVSNTFSNNDVIIEDTYYLSANPIGRFGAFSTSSAISCASPLENKFVMILDPSDGTTTLRLTEDLYTNLPACQTDFYPVVVNGTYSQYINHTTTNDPYVSFGDIQVADVANQYNSGKTYVQTFYFWNATSATNCTLVAEVWLMTFDAGQFTLRDMLHTNTVTYTNAYTDFQNSWQIYRTFVNIFGAKNISTSTTKPAEWSIAISENSGVTNTNTYKRTTDSGATFTTITPIDLGDGNQVIFGTYNDREDKWIGVAQPISYGGSQIIGTHDIYIADDALGTNMTLLATTPSSMSY